MTAELRMVRALMRRGLNEILRVPGGAVPGVLAPTIFMLGMTAVFGEASQLPGFDASDFRTFILPVGMLQGAGFTGAATGVNLARDIERGWFDRMLLARRRARSCWPASSDRPRCARCCPRRSCCWSPSRSAWTGRACSSSRSPPRSSWAWPP